MKQIFDWLREQINKFAFFYASKDSARRKYIDCADLEKIINEAEAKWKSDTVIQLAMMYAEALTKYGFDIRDKFETATQMTMALNEAYLRGRHDERIKISEVE